MDFSLNEIQQELSKTVSEFGKKRSSVERLRKMRGDALGWSPDVWREMGELGWIAAPFPEEVGGLGGSFADAALILEKFGRTLIPEPYTTALVAGSALLHCGTDAQREQYLQPLLAGETLISMAWAERDDRYNVSRPILLATPTDGGHLLEGEKRWVMHGNGAEHFLVTAATHEGPELFIVSKDEPNLKIQTVSTIDGHKAAHLQLNGIIVPDERRLGVGGDQTAALSRVFDIGAAAAVAEGLGIAQVVFEMTLEYLNTREQFGAKIGSFQALQHRAVDMFVEVELLRSINMASMVRVDDEDPTERKRWVSAAKTQLSTGGRYVVQDSIQLFGGIGVTDEHDVGLFFKRMHVLNAMFGDAAFHTTRFASLAAAE